MGEDPDWRGSSSYKLHSSIRHFSLFFTFLLLLPITEAQHSICGSIDIRNDARTVFNKENATDEFISQYIRNCTILEGTFSLSMITNSSTREEDFVTFPNLVEITGYLLVFNVKSLTSLSRIFPNLRVIGGSQLIMNYALIIYQNPDLKDVNLPNLRVIRNGGIRISENPSLCFVVHIDWTRYIFGEIDDIYVNDGELSGAVCADECDDSSSRCVRRQERTSCWNATTCQEECPYDIFYNQTTNKRHAGVGCLLGGPTGFMDEACHRECVGGCYEVNDPAQCVSCRGFLHEGRCVEGCPKGLFQYLSRCVNETQCFDSPPVRVEEDWRKHKIVNSTMRGGKNVSVCTYDCPAGYEEIKKTIPDPKGGNNTIEHEYCVKCEGTCPKKCKGKALDTIAMAKDLEGCNIIDGNLDIQLRDSSKMTMLTDALKDIEIIDGYLLIRFSPSLTSLSIFKKLKVITGKEVYSNKYALVIYENQNLNALFSTEVTNGLKISSGSVQVQNNRMLCFKHVDKMMRGLNIEVDQEDQSTYSNGDKAICDETNLVLYHENMLAEGFFIKWTSFNTSDVDHRKFLGYQVFYKRVDSNDLSKVHIEQDRSVCADTWSMHFEEDASQKTIGDEKKKENTTKPSKDDEITAIENGKTDVMEKDHDKLKKQNAENPQYVRALITHESILPYAYYAVYVQTKMVLHPGARNARSNVIIVQTQFSHPSPPRIRSILPIGTDELEVEWEEPSRPYGNITHYIVTWYTQERDISFEVKHACDAIGDRRKHHLTAPSTTLSPSTTPSQQSFVSSVSGSEDTCKATPGCCTCKSLSSSSSSSSSSSLYGNEDEEENGNLDMNHDFENAVQNIVFVPSQEDSPIRVKRTAALPNPDKDGEEIDDKKMEDEGKIPIEEKEVEPIMEKDTGEIEIDGVIMPHKRGYLLDTSNETHIQHTINVTAKLPATKFNIKGLTHATTYQISVVACQDVNAEVHFCSLKPAYKSQRTGEIKDLDKVPSSSIVTTVLNNTQTGIAFVQFDAPPTPNGRVHGFTVTLHNVNDIHATPISHCVNSSIFAGGVIIRGLADGTYEPSIKTITAQGGSEAVIGPHFTIKSPSFFTLPRILFGLFGLGCLIFLIAVFIIHTTRSMVGKKLGEYVRQTITANPEYLSQFDVYKQDEWELDRESLKLGEEIGRGTFGKVFRGTCKEVKSHCGTVFSECAIKTVSEDANPAERLHFLIEASVMKQFNSSFIIHLYGVVSDGQPVLVVMEMMAKGNLRDYLRSRRPEAEENTDHLPVPTDTEIMEWAAQIADGMSYLEHLKFCHRDLAARNCMIGQDNVVKIGDFGMARDIYYHEYYKPTGKRMMPVRWMAPESLKDGKFSLKSDVWAYGIVLYEMMTLAQQPYQGLANDEVFNYIGVSRRVLERPLDCPDFWYELMTLCWTYQPRERPSFRQIVECLCLRASDHFRQNSWVLNEAPIMDGEPEVEERDEHIVDEEVQAMLQQMHIRPERDMDEFSDRGTELMHSEEEDSV